ncbi:3-hydroxyacyl-ACP dehydratase FabZ family protein [Calycomorphotria hydatis]|uniref:3-hydroxyacyl-[acyl-carrier-protein] dehydratase FabZ n=1 Tax=Calycomorphotria hydatis TaxID=2528027 RepID=A0A517T8W9_9PLAN|nr:3-hydroxyacyl-ACP dehydratase FabZ family protein [Calycomorphotria hydatis]QDT64799.1 3-hydroxyacyl-[acyl-carrier-protein] dehydratase FabZ [Calycomorphotria hydatis]
MPLTTAEIEDLIPHRAPFLWLDEVTELDEEHLVARKVLDPTIDLFQGHYPNFPVLPGVIQCEMCFQASAVLIAKLHPTEGEKVPVVARLNNTKFRRLVRPGETVEIEVTITERLQDTFFFTGKVSVDGKVSTRCEFSTTAASIDQ